MGLALSKVIDFPVLSVGVEVPVPICSQPQSVDTQASTLLAFLGG